MKLNVKNNEIKLGTNILDLDVPQQLRTKHKSGLEFIDSALGGEGFTPSAVTFFTGEPGAGKTTMMLILADRLTKSGAVCLYNTAEESLFQVKLVCERLKFRNGFIAGQESHVPTLLKNADKLRAANPGKPFFLIIDSLQCLDDGFYKDGFINGKSAERSLALITDYCKQHFCNAVVIGQVNKSGQMSGTNKLKHMVDSMMHLSVEQKDEDLKGCRVLQTTKNRFGGCGHTFFLALHTEGFKEVARVSAA